jgi:Reverse transcriptase (RNA-dependent DNA polymerase)
MLAPPTKGLKARLVVQGNHQDESTFFDTFADTTSARSINILLSIAASENLEVVSIDVKTSFLYSPIKETVYLKRPPGLSINIMTQIVKLNKPLMN